MVVDFCGWFLVFLYVPKPGMTRRLQKSSLNRSGLCEMSSNDSAIETAQFLHKLTRVVFRFASNPFPVCSDLVFEDLVWFTNFSGIRFCAGRESMLWGSTTARVWTDTLANMLMKQFTSLCFLTRPSLLCKLVKCFLSRQPLAAPIPDGVLWSGRHRMETRTKRTPWRWLLRWSLGIWIGS